MSQKRLPDLSPRTPFDLPDACGSIDSPPTGEYVVNGNKIAKRSDILPAMGDANDKDDVEYGIEDEETFNFEALDIEEKRSLITSNFRQEPTKNGSETNGEEECNNSNVFMVSGDYIPPWRSCIALCSAFIFTLSAFEAIQNLQSSLNSSGRLGEISLSILYLAVLPGCFFGPVCAEILGHKGVLFWGFLTHLIYTCANVFPSWATLIPVSVAQGISSGGIGMSQGVYITAMSTSYVYYKGKPKSDLYGIMSFFNGLFFCSFKGTQITGNLLSSGILQSYNYNESLLRENKCGARVCSSSKDTTEFDRPSRWLLNAMFASFALSNVIGVAIIAIGLPRLKCSINKSESFLKVVKYYTADTFKMMINPKFVVLIPSIVPQSMILMAFFTGYTKAFVSCAVGVQWVGYSMVALGIVSSIVSLLANYLARYTGRILQFVIGMGLDISTVVIMLVWEPDYTTSPMALMIVPMMAGAAQGILEPQQSALIGSMFSKEELSAAFAAANAVKCFGFSIYLSVASTACLYHGLFLSLVLYLPGIIGYIYTEISERETAQDDR